MSEGRFHAFLFISFQSLDGIGAEVFDAGRLGRLESLPHEEIGLFSWDWAQAIREARDDVFFQGLDVTVQGHG